MDLSKIQQALSDAALPVSDFKNPTEDYVVNLLTEFLSKFSININLIDQVRLGLVCYTSCAHTYK